MFEIKENKIFINDIKIILNFTAIYLNLNNSEKIDNFIDEFFGNKNSLKFKDFHKKIVYENNFGLFLLILSIIFKFFNFSFDLNFILDQKKNIFLNNNNFEKTFSFSSNKITRTNSKFKKETIKYKKKTQKFSIF